MHFRLFVGFLALCVATGGLTGCGPTGSDEDAGPESTEGSGSQAEKLTKGGKLPAENDTLLLSYQQRPDTINAITASDNVSDAFHRHVYEYLGEADFKDPDSVLPGLATSWEFDEENLEFTIHLRKGVKWHPMKLPSGQELPETEFTSRDVKFTFDCVLNPNVEAAHIRSYYEDPNPKDPSERYKIKLTVVDDYTVKIKWTKPYFLAETFTLAGIPIIPRHVYSVNEQGEPISFDFSSKEFAEGFNQHWANTKMCGTGPMMFKEWEQGQKMVLVRNPGYWGHPYYFSQIVYRCIPNVNTSTQQGLQGELDWAGITQKDKYIQSADHKNVKSGAVKLLDFEYPGYRYIGYNLRRDLFQDKALRSALAHATPLQQMIDNVFEGLAVPVSGPFLSGSFAADPAIEPVPFDLDKARRILADAGWKDTNNNGTVDKEIKGNRLEAEFDMIIFADSPSFRSVAEIYKENCRKIRVHVQLTPAKWALMTQKLRKWEFDAAMVGWASGWQRGDPFQLWHGSQADVPDSSNHCGYRNNEVDALIEELRVTMDKDKQRELYHKIHRLIYEDQPYTFLFSEKATGVMHGRIENVKFYRLRPCRDSREWWATEPRILGQ